MCGSPPMAGASDVSVDSPSGPAAAVNGAANSDANPRGRGEAAAAEDEGSGASAPPDPPSRPLSGPSDRAPAHSSEAEEGPSWAAAVVEATSASVEAKGPNSTEESVSVAPSGVSKSKSDDAKTTQTPHFVVPPSPIELVRSDSLVRVPPRDKLERQMGEEMRPSDDSAAMAGEEAPSGGADEGIAKEQLAAEDGLAAVTTTSGTPPPLSEEADNDESVTTAPSPLPEGVHQKQPSGTHISEELAEEDVDVTPLPTEEDAEADSKPLMIESATTSPRSSVTSPMTLHLPQQQQMEQSPPPTNPSPLNLHSHAAAAHQQQQPNQSPPLPPASTPSKITYATPPPAHPGRRSIALRLLEELPPASPVKSPLISSVKGLTDTPFKSLRKFRSLSLSSSAFASGGLAAAVAAPSPDKEPAGEATVDRGTITVSWYEGTTSGEMQDHVFNCVLRKLQSIPEVQMKVKGGGKVKLEDVRLLDENVTPHGEVVLCPFLPDGSRFLLRFKLAIKRPKPSPAPANSFLNAYTAPSYISRPPDSPSAEPSPHPSSHPSNSDLASMDIRAVQQRHHLAQQNKQTQQMLGVVAALLQQQQSGQQLNVNAAAAAAMPGLPFIPDMGTREEKKEDQSSDDQSSTAPNAAAPNTPRTMNRAANGTPAMEPIAENPTDQRIEQQLRQLNELFLQRRSSSVVSTTNERAGAKGDDQTLAGDDDEKPAAFYREEKKQVIFIIANYFVLFMAFIALSAEIQNRLPGWMNWVQDNYDSVQNCATDRDALIECLSNGDFSGLVASFLLWITQSASAKRVFLFGFDTPKKLWTVVYEALVTAVCWGTSYLFIRRGLNPNTRHHFLHKYWKDAVYGSLAGFNAAFMKAVLKNLIPQDVALEALEGRQLRIFHWMGQMVGSVAEE
ncbi:hypothetical protein ACHAXT_008972 [Thalassiosira profunda]